MSTGTTTYFPSADMTSVRYPATAFPDCEYVINQQTMKGTIFNLASAQTITKNASVDLTWHGPTKTKRADSAWSKAEDPDDMYLSANYPGTEGFYVDDPDPSRAGRKQLAVACGSTHLGQGSKKAAILVLTDYLGPYCHGIISTIT